LRMRWRFFGCFVSVALVSADGVGSESDVITRRLR
jgi:hypothetical protein